MLSVPPPTRVAIGAVEIAGKRYEVFVSVEWARYFQQLNTTTNDINATINGLNGSGGLGFGMLEDGDSGGESIVIIQGAPGEKGDPGPAVGLLAGDGDASPEFVPGVPGPPGPEGPPGPAIFIMQDNDNNDIYWPIKAG
jgi:hypothetical protein